MVNIVRHFGAPLLKCSSPRSGVRQGGACGQASSESGNLQSYSGRVVGDSETVEGIARASRDNFSERYHLISVACGRQGRLCPVSVRIKAESPKSASSRAARTLAGLDRAFSRHWSIEPLSKFPCTFPITCLLSIRFPSIMPKGQCFLPRKSQGSRASQSRCTITMCPPSVRPKRVSAL